MAEPKKDGNVWRIQVYHKGERDSGTFTTKAQAQAWRDEWLSTRRRQKVTGIVDGKTVSDAFDRYEKEVSRTKRGHRFEALRMSALAEVEIGDPAVRFGEIKLSDLTAEHVAMLRDVRLRTGVAQRQFPGAPPAPAKTVKGSTVNRELNLVSNVFTVARREWKWIAESPTKDVRRPKNPAPRDRRPTADEIERLCFVLGFDEAQVTSTSQRVAVALLFAIESAMRAGEICGLMPEYIGGRVAHLPAGITKNGIKRDVPLSKRALELLSYLPDPDPELPPERQTVFGLSTASLDALFRKAKDKCQIVDLTFHDSRHEAITRLAKKLDVLALARMVGHRDLRMLQIYYNETAAELATRLD